jgi:hypothetical protein
VVTNNNNSTPIKGPRGGARPFAPCIDILEDFAQLSVPLDMMQCILCCAQSVYKTARDNAAKKDSKMALTEIGADNFFPILLSVLTLSLLFVILRRPQSIICHTDGAHCLMPCLCVVIVMPSFMHHYMMFIVDCVSYPSSVAMKPCLNVAII